VATQIIAPSRIVPFPATSGTEQITQAVWGNSRTKSRQLADQITAAEQSIETRLEAGAPVEAAIARISPTAID